MRFVKLAFTSSYRSVFLEWYMLASSVSVYRWYSFRFFSDFRF